MDWKHFKNITEISWSECDIRPEIWGYQIQPRTKWNPGLSSDEIESFEEIMGFAFPFAYKAMLLEINGLDHECVNVYGSEEKPKSYYRQCYKYPEDLKSVGWLLDEISENREYVHEALKDSNFNTDNILGFVPLYGHRVLVVFKDQKLSPVISIVCSDVIVYGDEIGEYWENELCS